MYSDQPVPSANSFQTNYNDRLDAKHIDVDPVDQSCIASTIRVITRFVGGIFSPRQVMVVLRLLKALTFCCLMLSIAAELIYIFFIQITVSGEVRQKLGGFRDMIIRIYGVAFAVVAILVELDMTFVNNRIPVLKSFIPRSLMIFLVTQMSAASPIIGYEHRLFRNQNKEYDDDANNGYYAQDNAIISEEVPSSVVAFQSVTTFFLFTSTLTYFFLGLLCLDRFTPEAFTSNNDPVTSTSLQNQKNLNNDSYSTYESDYDRHDRVNATIHTYSGDTSSR